MDSWFSQNKKALVKSLTVFAVSFGLVVAATVYVDFSQVDLAAALFLTATLVCFFAAKNIYDAVRATEVSEEMRKSVAVDLAVSSEELYIQLYRNSPVPYLIITRSGEIKSANMASARMLDLPQTQIKGKNIFEFLQCESQEHLDFLIEKYRSGVSVSDEMVKVKRADHREAWALLSLFGFTDIEGQRIGLLTLVDITKQKKAEDAKSEFVSLASHQLRTPIAGMKWSAELLQMDNPESLTERQHRYIDRLLISVRRMAILVDDFLRVSRFELGTFRPEYVAVDLIDLFEDIITEQEIKAKQKNLEIKTFYEKSVGKIVSDANLLRMIITNLYTNAIKYTPEQGTVHIGFTKKDGDILISVADNGMGIPATDQDEIFSKLFRASNAVRDVPDGTGLGLYIVREAVAVLKGNISFTSTEGAGTTFEVLLPLEQVEGESISTR